MDDLNSIRRYMGFIAVVSSLTGLLAVIAGYMNGMFMLVVLGTLMFGLPILLVIGIHVIEAGLRSDDVIEPSSSRPSQGDGSSGVNVQESPGTCPVCSGTLSYGKLHCPHCSSSIFQGAGDEASPPEF